MRRPLLTFWALSFLIAWAVSLPPALERLGLLTRSPIPAGAGILIGVAPIIAAAVAAATEGSGRDYWRSLIKLPKPSWTAAFALALPPALLALAYAIHAAFGKPIEISGAGLIQFAAVWLLLAFTEEAGWRGYALPRLESRFGFWRASLLLGVLWCVWHYPKLLGSPYLGNWVEAVPLIALFSVQIILANFIICWLYFRSGRSTTATTLFHTSFNLTATAYLAAATDPVIIAAIALVVSGIAVVGFASSRRVGSGR